MPRDQVATDPPVSEAQRRAMEAAAHGNSTLGIPKKVGEEFVGDDAKGHAAGILFVAPDGDVLLLRRSSAEANYAGHWALPGGNAEEGETPETAADREAKEEMGTAPAGGRKLLDQRITPTGMAFHTFAQPVEEKFAPKLNGEHSGYAWAPLDQLPQPLHPGVAATLKDRLGTAEDMTPEDWTALRGGFAKWTREEEAEPEHGEDAKFTKAEVEYSPGKGDDRCKACKHFEQPGACELVTGSINPDAWCELFKRAAAGGAQDARRVALDKKTVRTRDQDGHLRVETTPISKANVCPYAGDEIPGAEQLGLDPKKVYMLLRDPKELAKAAPTAAGKPLLLVHIPVSADDHPREVVVGSVGDDVEFKAPYLMAPLTVWDGEAIGLIESDKQRELSCAYHYTPDMTSGEYEGERYDGVMRDIAFNHVALVSEGRAGPDVIVGDSKLQQENDMTTKGIVLSGAGSVAYGALMIHLRGKLAKDAKIDLRPVLKDVTRKNFKTEKPRIAADVKRLAAGKLAKDADMADVVKLLDHLEEEVEGAGDALEPNAGMATAGKPRGEDEEDPRAKRREFLDGKLSAEDMAAYDELDQEAMDESEEEKAARERREKEAADKAARDAAEGEEPKVTKKAMDAALAATAARVKGEVLASQRAVREAEEIVRPYVGKLAIACDSAEGVYKAALAAMKVDVADVHPSAYRAVVLAQPLPGAAQRQAATIAADAAPTGYGFAELFPSAAPVAHA